MNRKDWIMKEKSIDLIGPYSIIKLSGYILNNKYFISKNGYVFGWDNQKNNINKEQCYFPKYVEKARNKIMKGLF